MPFCSKCGTEVAEGINFCGKCGNALGSGQSTNPNPAPTQTNYTASGGGVGTPFVMEKNMLFRIIGKLGYIFVIIGFCIDAAGHRNGFELANCMFDLDNKAVFGLLIIAVFLSALVGIITGILIFTGKNINTTIDWITSIVCVASGLIVYFGYLTTGTYDELNTGKKLIFTDDEYVKLQFGAYMILIGWIITFIGQDISAGSKICSLMNMVGSKICSLKKKYLLTIAGVLVIVPLIITLFFVAKRAIVQLPKFTDSRDNKVYRKVKIGTQTWMAENLNYEASGSVCYENNADNCATYGRLYNWETAKRVCPEGWHLPSGAEWRELKDKVDGNLSKLRSASGWDGTDNYGFSALPGGGGFGKGGGRFNKAGSDGTWWSANASHSGDQAISHDMDDRNRFTGNIGVHSEKTSVLSVRCVQD